MAAPHPVLAKMSDAEVLEAVKTYGSLNKAATGLGIARVTFQRRHRKITASYTTKNQNKPVALKKPRRGAAVKTWIFSSAQAHTAVHEGFMENLKAYAAHLNANIHISGFTYNMQATAREDKNIVSIYHPDIADYISNERFDVDGRLVFCGEMNTLPTATDPLSGFQTYTREKWAILPHPKVVLESVPTRLHDDPKIIMTTGAVTLPNYLQQKAGIKAEFHHVIGAVLVEIDSEGDFFCRHLAADKDGAFCDLNNYVADGAITEGSGIVEAITWGDIHAETLDYDTAIGSWGYDSEFSSIVMVEDNMLDTLKPVYQFFHDVIDFRRRNHHNVKDPHHWYKMHINGKSNVEGEFINAARFLEGTQREFCESIVIDSNHDRAFEKWLKTADTRFDPANALFFLEAQTAYYKAIKKREDNFLAAEWGIRKQDYDLDNVQFIPNTGSFVICGNIENALHGDKGANGAKGHIKSFSKMGPKANIADKHGAGIYEGIYLAGHSCTRDQGYNRGGLTGWNHSHIVTYSNGKRTIVTMRGQKWCAQR